MQYLTGISNRDNYSVGDTITYFTGNSRSVIWFLENSKVNAIITLRVSILQNSCQLLVNNVLVSKEYLTGSGCTIRNHYHGVEFQVIVSVRPEDPTLFDYTCISDDAKVFSFMSFPFLASLKCFLNVSIFYDPVNMQYEFQVVEYKWSTRILVKSIDDIRLLDRNLRSLYSYMIKYIPVLPKLKLTQSGTTVQVDGTIVATELQDYFNSLLAFDSSAYCPDLLEFFELPVSLRTFKYRIPTGHSISDRFLFQ